MDKVAATEYLESLLNKNLRVVVTDGRMFLGQFKCTDPDSNVILAHTYEYRKPAPSKVAAALAQDVSEPGTSGAPARKTVLDMTSRYLGLVVVPGKYIISIEVEEFASQLRKKAPPRPPHPTEQPTQAQGVI